MKRQRVIWKIAVMTLTTIAFVFAATAAIAGSPSPIVVKKDELTQHDVAVLFDGNFGTLDRISIPNKEIVIDDGFLKLSDDVEYYMIDHGKVLKIKSVSFKVGKKVGFQLDDNKKVSALYFIKKVKP